jgi:hypothetical protein
MRVERSIYDRLVAAYAERPGDHEHAARKCGVSPAVAMRVWREGVADTDWGTPIAELGPETTSGPADLAASVGEVRNLGVRLAEVQQRLGKYTCEQIEAQLERKEISVAEATALVRELSRATKETLDLADRARELQERV